MTTSGTYNSTTIDVATIIESAFRRCGKLPSTVSGELQLAARDDLHHMLQNWSNRGLSLWCVEQTPLGLTQAQSNVPLPVGTVGVLKVLQRFRNPAPGGYTTSATAVTLDTGIAEGVVVNSLAIMFTAASSVVLAAERSVDNLVWGEVGRTRYLASPAAAQTWRVVDAVNAPAARYWRLRTADASALPTVQANTFSSTLNEVEMARINRDQYATLPNKAFAASGSVLQFMYDKQVSPLLRVWPIPSDDSVQLSVWIQRSPQDVGAFSNTLDVPIRWLEAIEYNLAERIALSMPPQELPPGRLEYLAQKAQLSLEEAEDGETDGADIVLAPNLRGYT